MNKNFYNNKMAENNKYYWRVTIITFLFFLIVPIVLAVLFPEKTPTPVGREPLILPDEIGVDRKEFIPEKKIKSGSGSYRIHTEWNDLRDVIENHSEDSYDVENALEDLRREQEKIKELLKKLEKRKSARDNEEDFWTLKNREL